MNWWYQWCFTITKHNVHTQVHTLKHMHACDRNCMIVVSKLTHSLFCLCVFVLIFKSCCIFTVDIGATKSRELKGKTKTITTKKKTKLLQNSLLQPPCYLCVLSAFYPRRGRMFACLCFQAGRVIVNAEISWVKLLSGKTEKSCRFSCPINFQCIGIFFYS